MNFERDIFHILRMYCIFMNETTKLAVYWAMEVFFRNCLLLFTFQHLDTVYCDVICP